MLAVSWFPLLEWVQGYLSTTPPILPERRSKHLDMYGDKGDNTHKNILGGDMKIINLKDFPEELHRKAKAKAALMGISLRELIIRAITEYIKKEH